MTSAQLYAAALVPMPEDGGDLDLGRVNAYHQWLEDSGVDGIFAAGTTGEFIALDDDERTAVIANAVEVFGTERVIAHTGAPSLRQASRLTTAARDAGASRFAAMTPFFEVAHPASLEHYYTELAGIAGGAFYAYHFPVRTNASFGPSQVRGLTARAGLAGIKVSGVSAPELLSYVDHANRAFEVFTGNDITFAECVAGGAAGAVSGISAAFPRVFVRMRDALRAGDAVALRGAQADIEQAIAAVPRLNFQILKKALELQGVPAGTCRVALDEPSPEELVALEATMERLGLQD